MKKEIVDKIILNKKIFIYLFSFIAIGIILIMLSNGTHYSETQSISNNCESEFSKDKLLEILKKVDGVGDLEIYYSKSNNYEQLNDDNIPDADSEKNSQRISGMILVAEGADNENTSFLLKKTVSEVMDVPIHKIAVLKMK